MTRPIVLACGMGVNTIGLLAEYVRRGQSIDAILFGDTGGEHEWVYRYLPILSAWPTPLRSDGAHAAASYGHGNKNPTLLGAARAAAWATPIRSDARGPSMSRVTGGGSETEASALEDGARTGPLDPWRRLQWLPCTDGKARPVEPGLEPLAHGVSGRMVVRRTVEQAGAEVQEEHWYNRCGALHGLGNAIVPQLAAVFIRCAEEARRSLK